jgi:hypothetical protein
MAGIKQKMNFKAGLIKKVGGAEAEKLGDDLMVKYHKLE